ncbi:thiamine kinase [Kosakonia radicincitans]|uniref:thiamine kinase n=1 Tax=Kosakonia radicincitans TaxID=283686 RepID=UPI0005C2F529|nr:thiamine kinase [Kosakonia radicincitans]KIS44992.1 thiamine kinase [Kosakonia radicincitans YD4]
MRFSNNKQTRDRVLSRYFPTYTPVASQNSGLSGGSCLIHDGQHTLVLRQRHQAASSPFLRQYRLLRRLPATLAPRPQRYTGDWMAVEFIPGEIKTALPQPDALAALLRDLHRQPLFGWRITLLPLLDRYWQQSAPTRRTPFWLRQLKQLRKQGEPQPLRLAPLHMDVHAGNLVHSAAGLRLIDWEYAGDGDVALELAAVWTEDEAQRQRLVAQYAQQSAVDPAILARQVRRWQPWIGMLMAGWFECRWQQTGEQQFITLAEAIWRRLQNKE